MTASWFGAWRPRRRRRAASLFPMRPRRSRCRARPVETSHAREVGLALRGNQIDPTVLEVLRAVPRHQFVPESLREASYADRALPIGFGQTISQPFIVALMTDVLNVGPNGVVLEV